MMCDTVSVFLLGAGGIPRAPRVDGMTWYTAPMLPADCPPAAVPRKQARSRSMILHGAGYLTTAGVAVAELLEIPLGPRFGWTAGLLAAFGLILSFIFNTERARGKGGFLAAALAASAIGIAIMVVGATPIFGAILFFILCTIVGMRLSLGAAIAWVAGATSILQKIDARDRTQAALKARELGLLEE